MKFLAAMLALFVLVSGCTSEPQQASGNTTANEDKTYTNPAELQYVDISDNDVQVTNGVKHLVPLEDIYLGCSGKDCIPSIDKPKYVTAREAAWLKQGELVLGIDLNGFAFAYPISILNWHEIVNDSVNGLPIVISYCPLCATGIAYERTVDGNVLNFGVSGRLYNSDLVMYDRQTGTFWQQVDGIAIVGELTGKRLKRIPVSTVTWNEWLAMHPETKVLSRETGFARNYDAYPYGDYQTSTDIFFPISQKDNRLFPKDIVYGVELGNNYKAYANKALKKGESIKDKIGGNQIEILKDNSDSVKAFLLDENSGRTKEIIPVHGFWFAWYAFHPTTAIYK